MKTLYLLRHAKSSWDDTTLSDFDRTLNERGLRAAPLMGRKIFEEKFPVDLIVSSPAKRARETARLLKDAADIDGEILFDERIYEASPRALFEIVSEISDEKNAAMLVGHNPGLEGFVKILTGKIEAMPTAALAVIDLNVERWSLIAPNCGNLRRVLRPKSIE